MPVLIREASSVVVRAPPQAVARALEGRGAVRDGASRYVLRPRRRGGGPLAARREAWFLVRDATDGTEVVHAVAVAPANLAQDLVARLTRAGLAEEVQRALADVKREAERADVRRAFPPVAP